MHDPITPEIMAQKSQKGSASVLLKYFACGHLPPTQRMVSAQCARLAAQIQAHVPACGERHAALNSLLIAKDHFVRASLDLDPDVVLRGPEAPTPADTAFNKGLCDAAYTVINAVENTVLGRRMDYDDVARFMLNNLPAQDYAGQAQQGMERLADSLTAVTGAEIVVHNTVDADVHYRARCDAFAGALFTALTTPAPKVQTPVPPPSDARRAMEEHVKSVQALLSQLVAPLVAQPINRTSGLASDTDILNRFAYHRPKTENTALRHDAVRMVLGAIAGELRLLVPEGRERAMFLTKLEEAMFSANAGIARNQPEA